MASTSPTAMSSSEEGPPYFAFTTVEDLFQQIDNTAGDALVITQVPPRAFEEIDEAREAACRKFRCSLYTASTQVLAIAIPTLYHEAAHRQLDAKLTLAKYAMGVGHDWLHGGGATFKQMDGDTLVTSGEGDSVGQPHSMRPSVDHWPTIAVECSLTQTLTALRAKACWWFSVSNYEVKTVLLLKLNRPKESMLIEQWTTPRPVIRHGATMTRAAAALRPQCVQSISITRNANISDIHPDRLTASRYVVHGGPLRLAFADLFLRPPTPGTLEGEIVIDDDRLRHIALCTWRPVA